MSTHPVSVALGSVQEARRWTKTINSVIAANLKMCTINISKRVIIIDAHSIYTGQSDKNPSLKLAAEPRIAESNRGLNS
jgi:hypothetical protein